MDEQTRRWHRLCGKTGCKGAAREIVAQYLSPDHRDRPGTGCPLPALAVEFGREDLGARQVFAAKLEEMMDALASGANDAQTRQEAAAMLAAMLGAVVLARACAGTKLSSEILELVRQHLLQLPDHSSRA